MSKAIDDLKKIAFNIELIGIKCFGDEFRNIIKELEENESLNSIIEEYDIKPSEIREAFIVFQMFRNEPCLKKAKAFEVLKELLLLEVREIGGKYYIKYRNLEEDNYIDYEISEELYEVLK